MQIGFFFGMIMFAFLEVVRTQFMVSYGVHQTSFSWNGCLVRMPRTRQNTWSSSHVCCLSCSMRFPMWIDT